MVDSTVMQSGRYKAYPEYKDSGVEWLGDIPSGWSTIPVGRLYHRNKRTGFSEKELLSVYRDYGVIPKSSRDDNNNKPSEDLSPYQLVKPDDLVMNKMKAWQGSIAISEYEGIVSPAYFVYEPERKMYEVALPRYVHYLLRNPMYITQYMSRSKGIRVNQWDLDPDEFQKIELLLPSKPEQSKIFEFLDYETAKIDTLIQKQQRLIELLTEKRQAVISHAVTKGLNPDVPMKDSGVEWLGEVPEHWEVTKVGWVLEYLSYGFTNPMPTSDEGPYMLTATDISFNEILFDQARTTTTNAYDNFITDKSRPKLGDLLLTKDGTLGRVAVFNSTNKTCISQSIALLRPNRKYVLPYFMAAALASSRYQEKMIFDAGGTTIKHIYISILAKMNLALPDVNEQQEIVSYIDSKCLKLDDLMSKAEQAIQLMQERRTALISAAVTGKIDVRDWETPVASEVYS